MRHSGKYLASERGQAIVEYAYLLLFIALAVVAAYTALGINVLELFNIAV